MSQNTWAVSGQRGPNDRTSAFDGRSSAHFLSCALRQCMPIPESINELWPFTSSVHAVWVMKSRPGPDLQDNLGGLVFAAIVHDNDLPREVPASGSAGGPGLVSNQKRWAYL